MPCSCAISNRAATSRVLLIDNAYPTGGTKATLPYVANALDNTYNTRFAIANTGLHAKPRDPNLAATPSPAAPRRR